MLLLLSPAKSLDFESAVPEVELTEPAFARQTAQLITLLRQKSPQDLAELMHLSDALASLNVARYQSWRTSAAAQMARAAAFAFNGDVYLGLRAADLDHAALQWLQSHVCILSGLYGILRPLDRIRPYRLEMGSPLVTQLGQNLYEFWGERLNRHLAQRLRDDPCPVLVNLASQEYFKAVDTAGRKAPVVTCVFEEYRSGQYKVVSFMAKRARGLMARFAAEHALQEPAQLRDFNTEGYAFAPAASTAQRLVFRRRTQT